MHLQTKQAITESHGSVLKETTGGHAPVPNECPGTNH